MREKYRGRNSRGHGYTTRVELFPPTRDVVREIGPVRTRLNVSGAKIAAALKIDRGGRENERNRQGEKRSPSRSHRRRRDIFFLAQKLVS